MSVHGRPQTNAPPEESGRVVLGDLNRLGALSSLLATLNDPRAGADALARHVEQIPVLRVRVAQRFGREHPSWTKHGLPQQIALLGNRVLEGILLELLEDIVALHSDIGDPGARDR